MPRAFDWRQARILHRGSLPHLRQDGVVYFVTFRLADSLPADVMKRLRAERDAWMTSHPPPLTDEQNQEFRRIWSARIERLLDNGHGECVLRNRLCREAIEATLCHDDGKLYLLGDFAIMPNHVHGLLQLLADNDLSRVLQSWKSIGARQINRIAKRSGQLWQDESFDHIVRDETAMARLIQYIKDNPRHLPTGSYTLGHGLLQLP
jgi:REP element-mobilizing transposase RayT